MIGTARRGGYKTSMMYPWLAGAIAVAAMAPAVRSQATPRVPPGERVYVDIDHLAAAGLIDTIGFGARPLSTREVVRLLTEAQRNMDRNAGARAWAETAIASDLALYTHEARAIDEARVEIAYLRSPYRRIPADRSEERRVG